MTTRFLRLWPFLVLFGAVAFCLWYMPSGRVLNEGEGFDEMIPNGEAFLHHLPRIVSTYRMPMGAVVMAWHHGHSPQWAQVLLKGVLWSAPVVLAFLAGGLLQSPAAGVLSALAAAAPLAMNETGMGEELIYRLLLGLVALVLVWRSERPGVGRSVMLGLAIGVSLLCRSPLCLLPVLLAFCDLRVRRPAGRPWPSLALICASFILLAPWVLLTWRLDGGFIPFENGRGNSNMTTGALGIVASIAGNYRELAGIPESQPILPWALRQIAHHPLRYAAGCLGRAWFVFRLQPLLCLAAAASVWLNRRREAYRMLGLFCAYFIGMHCLLSIEKRYLEPIWFLLATLGLSGAAAFPSLPKAPGSPRGPLWLLWPYMGTAMASGALTLHCLWTYPTDALLPMRTQIARAVSLHPEDAWLIHLEDRELLRTGRGPMAVDGARTALRLQPKNRAFLFAYVWALATEGRATREWMDRITKGLDPFEGNYRDKICEGYLLKTLWRLADGDRPGAARAYADALERERSRLPRLKLIESRYEREVERRLHQVDKYMVQKVIELLDAWPPPAQAVLARRLMALVDSPRMRAELRALLSKGDRRSAGSPDGPAMRPLRKADSLSDGAVETHRKAMVYQGLREYSETLRLLQGLVSAYPANAKLRGDRGVAYALLGRTEEAVKDLEAAIRIDPYQPAAYLSLGSLLTGGKRHKEALELYETALRHDCFKIDPVICGRIRDERDRMRRLGR